MLRCCLILLTGCGASLARFPFDAGSTAEPGDGALEIRFHGVTTFTLHAGDVGVLTDPFWSHQRFARVAFGRIAPDPDQIEPWDPRLGDVRAVVVGHGHYDHVLDLPLVAPALHPDAVILASETVAHTFAASPPARPIRTVNQAMATPEEPGAWHTVVDGRLRVLPIRSGHPSQYLGFHVYRRRLTEDREAPPTRAGHFQEGQTIAWLVDFLDGEEIAHRVFVESSSTGLPAGQLPASVLREHPIDVAIVSMDVATAEANGETTAIDLYDPPVVIASHYENFFRPKELTPREGVKVQLYDVHSTLDARGDRTWLFPAWGARFVFSPAPDR